MVHCKYEDENGLKKKGTGGNFVSPIKSKIKVQVDKNLENYYEEKQTKHF